MVCNRPVNGIQVQKGKYKGRLVILCDHIEAVSKNIIPMLFILMMAAITGS